ncbi:Uncharacterised protein [Mycobacteroides abscessus subsp. abscessus]|uniref:hypothetical protein n=1 Tax=Mycobacteroides abscessus TaxID=36809 RepID=UPI00092ABA6C|nr:hypothetical protein [Mycobacteroides abscessus]SIC56481.1 Uncharacterised protein [Mycobacteroides abscessus subsp. abscessus]SKU57671.1 Uncharacterised protein [Mycobacteroides abscessus subsp. abscessus]
MTLEWGQPKSPSGYVMAVLKPLGFLVTPEYADGDAPCFKITDIPGGKSDRISLNALVQVESLATDSATANGRATAFRMAWDADHALMSMNDWDEVTLPDGSVASATLPDEGHMPPAWHEFRDPLIKAYVARYALDIRFTYP